MKPKTKQVSLRMPAKTIGTIGRIAKAAGTTPTTVFNVLLAAYLENLSSHDAARSPE